MTSRVLSGHTPALPGKHRLCSLAYTEHDVQEDLALAWKLATQGARHRADHHTRHICCRCDGANPD